MDGKVGGIYVYDYKVVYGCSGFYVINYFK